MINGGDVRKLGFAEVDFRGVVGNVESANWEIILALEIKADERDRCGRIGGGYVRRPSWGELVRYKVRLS